MSLVQDMSTMRKTTGWYNGARLAAPPRRFLLPGSDPASEFGGGAISVYIWQSSLITVSLPWERDEEYFTTLLWQNTGRKYGLKSRMLFSEVYNIMVKLVS